MKHVLNLAVLAIGLSACSLNLPLRGQFQNSDETFTGNATGDVDGSGNISLTSSNGAVCKGDFLFLTKRTGGGVFNCNDGRSGPFQFVSTGSRGTGHGSLSGQKFTFTFGDWSELFLLINKGQILWN